MNAWTWTLTFLPVAMKPHGTFEFKPPCDELKRHTHKAKRPARVASDHRSGVVPTNPNTPWRKFEIR